MGIKIGFDSTRFAGTDGVSLESAKWVEIFWQDRHTNYCYSGRSPEVSMGMPEAYFGHPENLWINDRIWGVSHRPRMVSERIRNVADYLKATLYAFVERFGIELLVPENALTIPMHAELVTYPSTYEGSSWSRRRRLPPLMEVK